jgi:hypothetical protein
MWRVTSASQVARRTEGLRRLQLRLIEFGDRCDVRTAAARYVAMVFDGADNSDDLARLWRALRDAMDAAEARAPAVPIHVAGNRILE